MIRWSLFYLVFIIHWIFLSVLWSRYYFTFQRRKLSRRRWRHLSKLTEPVSGRTGIWTLSIQCPVHHFAWATVLPCLSKMCQNTDRGMWWKIMHDVFDLARLWVTRITTFWLHGTSRHRKENSLPFIECLGSFSAFERISDTLFLFCVTFWKALQSDRPQRYFQANAISKWPALRNMRHFFFLITQCYNCNKGQVWTRTFWN